MKFQRQAKILEIIEKNDIETQEELSAHLRAIGFETTQATVSRDIRELGLIKVSAGAGKYRYVSAAGTGKNAHSPGRFEMIFRESVLKVDYAGHFVLVKCYSGMANAACEVFDSMTWDDVVGTLSGDDTFLILMRTEEAAQRMTGQLAEYMNR